MDQLTPKQGRVLRIIAEHKSKLGFPPTLQELASELGVASKNAVIKHLQALEKKGYILRSNLARGIRILQPLDLLDQADETSLPLVGTITAGLPMLAEENIEDYVSVPKVLIKTKEKHFILRVQGESMKGVGILDGDLVVVKSTNQANNGEFVAALIGNEATIKRLVIERNRRYLKAENPEYRNIYPEGAWSVQGKVVGLIRSMS